MLQPGCKMPNAFAMSEAPNGRKLVHLNSTVPGRQHRCFRWDSLSRPSRFRAVALGRERMVERAPSVTCHSPLTNLIQAAHIRPEGFRNNDTAVFLLIVL